MTDADETPQNRRAAYRQQMAVEATMTIGGEAFTGDLDNLSAAGALLVIADAPSAALRLKDALEAEGERATLTFRLPADVTGTDDDVDMEIRVSLASADATDDGDLQLRLKHLETEGSPVFEKLAHAITVLQRYELVKRSGIDHQSPMVEDREDREARRTRNVERFGSSSLGRPGSDT